MNLAEKTWLVTRRDEVLGEEVDNEFCTPGAYHRARWMVEK